MSSAGAVTGTPSMTTPYSSPFTVRVTVTDSSTKRTYSDSFTWTVGFPPLVASNPGTQTSTVNRAITSTTLTATGGSGSYAWSDPSTTLPPGVTISSAGATTCTPTATGSFSVSLKVVDTSTVPPSNSPQTVSFSWKVNVAPSVMTPANQHGEATVAATNLTVAASGGTSPYSFTAAGLPTGLSINSASGVISGTPTTAGTFSVTVTVTDAFGATATSGAFSWTIVAAPIVTVPNQVTQRSTTVSLSIAPDVSGGSGTYSTYAATGLPSGLSISATTGVISGKTASSSSKSTVTITVTDSAGAKATTTFTWWVTNLAITSPGNQSTRHGTAASVSLSASGGTSPYTYTATNLPSWLSVSGTKIVGTAPATTGVTSNITVTVTDSTGAFVTSTTFTWTVT